MTGSAEAGRPVPAMRLALAGSLLLVIAGLIAFALASRVAHQAPANSAITVTVTARACEPDSLTVPAGKPSFAIVNSSDRVLEWEILDGVMVVAERENITPGMTATLNPRLEAGHYAITCGLLSNPHGTLVVTPSAEAERTAPSTLVALIGPLAE